MPFSRSLRVNTSPAASLSSSCRTKVCFSFAIWTMGPEGSITKPSHVFVWERAVFFQLKGVPTKSSTTNKAVEWSDP